MKYFILATLGIALFWPMLFPGLTCVPFLLTAWVLYVFVVRSRNYRPLRIALSAGLCLLIFYALLSPVAISFQNRPGPPHLVPLAMGLPTPEMVESAQQGELFLGGCVPTGYEPEYILVW
ncbi:MAG: hypothetical protein WC901_04675 [Candidatus Margulisiibacteriota bacterium]